MADRVYPSAKPATNGTAAPGGGNPSFPATKAQMYNTARPLYRPQPPRRSRRSCCCSCCLWTTLLILILLVLATVAGAVIWVLYRPHRPSFSVAALQISQFNLTSSQLNAKFNISITARNPNKKLQFFYDPISVSISADGVNVGSGSFPAFAHGTKNTTTLRTAIVSKGQSLDDSSATLLKSDLKNKNGLPIKIQLDTKVKVKMGGVKTKKVPVRVKCSGVTASVPTGKAAAAASTADAKCKVDLRIKIWKWTL
ncbi:NDR1/HIN1-like protein 6 [Diospyros lotus]|uniref:NDR1/HIN1-like protein 6 n=1 Tax=Diospyros lotus TaxID=55363 RepID=UPI002257D20C|nr:NDR1/HIN1-like protein 6 [Diospyros lotus]